MVLVAEVTVGMVKVKFKSNGGSNSNCSSSRSNRRNNIRRGIGVWRMQNKHNKRNIL